MVNFNQVSNQRLLRYADSLKWVAFHLSMGARIGTALGGMAILTVQNACVFSEAAQLTAQCSEEAIEKRATFVGQVAMMSVVGLHFASGLASVAATTCEMTVAGRRQAQ